MAADDKGHSPLALIVHRCSGRIRLRIHSRRGNRVFFSRVSALLVEAFAQGQWCINVDTGSILLIGPSEDIARVNARALADGLFCVVQSEGIGKPVSHRMAASIGGFNRFLEKATNGFIDLPNLLFLVLVGVGVVELARGNFKSPPWHTAFWYAFGLFTRSVVDTDSSGD